MATIRAKTSYIGSGVGGLAMTSGKRPVSAPRQIRPCRVAYYWVREPKSRLGPMLGFKRFTTVAIVIAGIELVRRIHKGQFNLRRLGHQRWKYARHLEHGVGGITKKEIFKHARCAPGKLHQIPASIMP